MATVESIRLVGYACVSNDGSRDPFADRCFEKAGVSVIYQEKTSSVGARPELHRLLIPWAKVIAWSFTRWIVSPVL